MRLTRCLNDLELLRTLISPGFFVVIFLICCNNAVSQRRLDIYKTNYSAAKRYSLEEGDYLSFKSRALRFYQTKKIISLSDSMMILEGGTELKLRDLYSIRFNRDRHLIGSFKLFFLELGLGFFPLNTLNQVITQQTPVFQASAAYVSASLLGVGLVLRELGFKRMRTKKNTAFKVLDFDFYNLGEKKEVPMETSH